MRKIIKFENFNEYNTLFVPSIMPRVCHIALYLQNIIRIVIPDHANTSLLYQCLCCFLKYSKSNNYLLTDKVQGSMNKYIILIFKRL